MSTAIVGETESPANEYEFTIENTQPVAIGNYMALNTATGQIRDVADTAGFVPLGFLRDFNRADLAPNGTITGDTTLAVPHRGKVDLEPVIRKRIPVAGAAAETDVGSRVFATGPNAFQLAATVNIGAVGRILRFHSATQFDVLFFGQREERS